MKPLKRRFKHNNFKMPGNPNIDDTKNTRSQLKCSLATLDGSQTGRPKLRKMQDLTIRVDFSTIDNKPSTSRKIV